ncbi:hypothetical protein HPB47_026373, partial [Ixodes persulcatus]
MNRLRRKRAVIRSAVTRATNDLQALLNSSDAAAEEMDSVEAYQVSICRLRTRATLKLDALRTPNIVSNAVERLQDRDQGHQRWLYDDIKVNVRSLEALGVKAEEYSVLLHAAVKKRLPDDLVLRYCQQRATDTADSTGSLQTFLNFLKSKVESRERVLEIKPDQASPSEAQKEDSFNQVRKAYITPSAAALAARTHAQDAKYLFCDAREHSFDQCNARSISEKKEILKRDGRCFRRFKRYHRARDCRNARFLRCANCQGRHMTCLCDPDLKPTKDSPHSSSQPGTSEVSVTSAVSNSVETVLLQTATIWAEGETKRRVFRCLLDGGSQRTFVTSRLVNELSCKVLGKEALSITVFGDTTLGNASKLRKVEVCLQSQYDQRRVRIEALEVPAICHSSAFPVSLCRTAQTCTLQLADPLCSGVKRDIGIDILIGADNYWKAVTGSIKRLDEDLTAVETIFRWTLQGPVRPLPEVGWHQATVMQVMTRHQSDQPSQQLRERNTPPVVEEDMPEPKQSTIKSEPVPEEAARKDSDVESDKTEALEWAPCTVLAPCNSPGNSRESVSPGCFLGQHYPTRKGREDKKAHPASLPSRNSGKTVGLILLGGRMLENGHETTKKWATGSRAEKPAMDAHEGACATHRRRLSSRPSALMKEQRWFTDVAILWSQAGTNRVTLSSPPCYAVLLADRTPTPRTTSVMATDEATPLDITRLHHVVAALPPETAADIRDIILEPPTTNPYDTLKAELIKRTSASEHRGLPNNVRMVLTSASGLALVQLAQLADTVMEVAAPQVAPMAALQSHLLGASANISAAETTEDSFRTDIQQASKALTTQ